MKRIAFVLALATALMAGWVGAQTTVVDLTPYGQACGPVLTGAVTEGAATRMIRLDVYSAKANAAGVLFLGDVRLDFPIGTTPCRGLTRPLISLPFVVDAQGRSTLTFPSIPKSVQFRFTIQAALFSGGSLQTTNGVDLAVRAKPTFNYFGLNQVLATGQSNSLGTGSSAISLTQPFANSMFNTGVSGNASTLLIPLVEQALETPYSGMANLVTSLARSVVFTNATPPRNTHDLVMTSHGENAQPYVGIKRATPAWTKAVAQVQRVKAIAGQQSLTHVVRAVTNIHGESDHVFQNPSYDQDLKEWQGDYETRMKQISGQSEPIPMLFTQISSWTNYGQTTSAVAMAQLKASVDNSGKLVLVGPRYHLPYTDGEHHTSDGFRHLGEDFAKVYRRVVLEGRAWEPVRPAVVTLQGTVITALFHVPSPPLVLDTTRVSNPGDFGFEYTDDSASPPAIQSVVLAGPDVVKITLSAAPQPNAKKRLRYAYTGQANAPAGPTTGPRGNLRDSDSTPSRHSYDLFNWSVHFEHEVK